VKRERPLPIRFLAWVSIILGGVGLVAAITLQALCWSWGGSLAVIVPLGSDETSSMRTHLGGFVIFENILPGAALLLTALTFLTGLGLLSMRPWARRGAQATASAVLAVLVMAALYEFAVLLPAMEEWREQSARRGQGQLSPFAADVQCAVIALLVGGLVFFVHAVVTLAVLRSPVVIEAFRKPTREDGKEAACPHNYSTATS
jgi:hypothetical protein